MKLVMLSMSSLTALLCVLAGMTGCRTILGPPSAELIVNPSFHILVNDEQEIPAKGTFDFDTQFFKVNYTEDIDLAAVDARIRSALEAELKQKGFTYSSESPDVLVSYAAAIDAAISGSDFNEAYAEEFPIAAPDLKIRQDMNYHQGALIVDFVDRKSRKLLWRGAVMANVSMDVSVREKEQRVRHATRILLGHFPVPMTGIAP
jgi:hypothetical protein